jgi:Arsenical resistance operon protein ArsD
MMTIRVFDPAMCCSTGVCGPSVDPQLARFAADLDWLKSQGIAVERFNLSKQPRAFAGDAAVKAALETQGEAGLPLVKVNGEVKSSGTYPSRAQLAAWVGVPVPGSEEPSSKLTGCCSPASKGESAAPKTSGCC